MHSHFAIEAALGFGPIVLFLLGLLYLDSFKLVDLKTVILVVVAGAVMALACYYLSGPVMDFFHLDYLHYSRYLAPVLEECLKAAVMIYLFWRNRIGFMVDAAILGLAVGAGFSLFENVYYAYVFPEANVGVWMVRGLGTAIMHGGVSAIFGVTAQGISERHARFHALNYIPGLILAVSLHSIFNQFTQWPIPSAAATVIVLPMVLLFIFDKSEHEVHDWLIHDYESHEHLLADIRDGTFAHSEGGRFINDLAAKYSAEVVADMFNYLSVHTELVLQAEKLLLAREKGEPLPVTDEVRYDFYNLHALEKKIGRTAMLTIWPHLKFSHQELWELHELEGHSRHA